MEGLQAPDRYTLRIKLTEPYPQFKYILSMPYTAAVPSEAVKYYGDDFVNHPVGTGAFRLKEWSRRYRLILERNPTYWDERYPSEGSPGDKAAGLLADAGKRLPLVDEVYFTIITETPPAWILFKQGYLAASGISKDNFREAISPTMGLTAGFKKRGITLTKTPEMSVYYVGFNMTDKVVGTNRKLRQAMSLAYDTEWRIKNLMNGRAISAQGPLPPGVFGYDPDFKNPYKQSQPEEGGRTAGRGRLPQRNRAGRQTAHPHLSIWATRTWRAVRAPRPSPATWPSSASRSTSSRRPGRSSSTRPTRAACRSSSSAGSSTTRTRRTSCSSSTAPTRRRARTPATTRTPSTTSST